MNLLFVCSQGVNRSRTAETFSILGGVQAKSCGTDHDAITPVNNKLLRWANHIVCMEQEHARLIAEYMGSEDKDICSLNIRDVYNPFDELLVGQLIGSLRHKIPEASLAIERGRDLAQEKGYVFFR